LGKLVRGGFIAAAVIALLAFGAIIEGTSRSIASAVALVSIVLSVGLVWAYGKWVRS
jgi:hypothetical protein